MKLLLCLLMLPTALFSSVLLAKESPAPVSFQHCNRFFVDNSSSDKDDALGYITRDLAQEIGRRLSLSIVDVKAPIKRCLRMLQSGEVDFMLLVQITNERSKFIDFVLPSDSEFNVVFMVRKEDGDWLRDYEDLNDTALAIVNGYNYFPKLDGDNSVNKLRVSSPAQLPLVLLANRVDSFATYQGFAKDISIRYPNIIKASYSYSYGEMSFLGISKSSSLHLRLSELNRIIQDIVNDGTAAKIKNNYSPELFLPYSQNANG